MEEFYEDSEDDYDEFNLGNNYIKNLNSARSSQRGKMNNFVSRNNKKINHNGSSPYSNFKLNNQYLNYQMYYQRSTPISHIVLNSLRNVIELVENKREYINKLKFKLTEFLSNQKIKNNTKNWNKYKKINNQRSFKRNNYITRIPEKKNLYYFKNRVNKETTNPLFLNNSNNILDHNTVNYDTNIKRNNFKKYMTKNLNPTNKDKYTVYRLTISQNNNLINTLINNNNSYDNSDTINLGDYNVIQKKNKKNSIKYNKQFNANNTININNLPYNSPHKKNFILRKKSPKDIHSNINQNSRNLLNKKINSEKIRNFDINFSRSYKNNSILPQNDKNSQQHLKSPGFSGLVPIKNISLMKNEKLEELDINEFVNNYKKTNLRESSHGNLHSYAKKKLINKSKDNDIRKTKKVLKIKCDGENKKKTMKNIFHNNAMSINNSLNNLYPDIKNNDLLVSLNCPKKNEKNYQMSSPKVYKKSNSLVKRKKFVGIKRDSSIGNCDNINFNNNTVEDYNYYPEVELKDFSINNNGKNKVNSIHKHIIYEDKTNKNITPENDLNTNQTSKSRKKMGAEIKNNNNNSNSNNNTHSEEISFINQNIPNNKDINNLNLNSPLPNTYFYSTIENLNKANKVYVKPSQIRSKSKLKKLTPNDSTTHDRNTISLIEVQTHKIKNTKLLSDLFYSPISNYTSNYYGTNSNMETENYKISSSLNTSTTKHKNNLTKVKNKNCFIQKIRNYNKKIGYINKCYFSKIFIEKKNKINFVIIRNKKNSIDMKINNCDENDIINLYEETNEKNKRSFSYYFIIDEKKLINKAKKNFELYFTKKKKINYININKRVNNKNYCNIKIKSNNDTNTDNEKGKNLNVGINILNNLLLIKNNKQKTNNANDNNIEGESKIMLGTNKLDDIHYNKKSNKNNNLYRDEIILLLNKLSISNYDEILNLIKNILFVKDYKTSKKEIIYSFVDIIINKGCKEKLYSNLYAKFCKDLHNQTKDNKDFEDESLSSIIQHECSFRFNKNLNHFIFLGLIKFIFELVKVGIININTIFNFLEIIYAKYLKDDKNFEFKYLYLESIVELVNKLGEIVNENNNYKNLKNDLDMFVNNKIKTINNQKSANIPSYLRYKIINLLEKHENNYKMSFYEKYIEDKINFVLDKDDNYNEEEDEEYYGNKEKEDINNKQSNDDKNDDIEIQNINKSQEEISEVNSKKNIEENKKEEINDEKKDDELNSKKNALPFSPKRTENNDISQTNNINKNEIDSTNIDTNNNKITTKKKKSKKSKSKSRSKLKNNNSNNQQASPLLELNENDTQSTLPTPSSYNIPETTIISQIKNDLINYFDYLNNLQIKDKSEISEDINNSYDWTVIDDLLKVHNIKLEDIILFYVNICKNVVDSETKIFMANEYIKTIIEYYKSELTQNKKYLFHLNMIKIYLDINNIIYESELMFEIMGKLLFILLVNKLFFMKDLNVFIGQTEDAICNISKVVKFTVICGENLIKQYHNDFKFTKLFSSNAKIFEKYVTQDLNKNYGLEI